MPHITTHSNSYIIYISHQWLQLYPGAGLELNVPVNGTVSLYSRGQALAAPAGGSYILPHFVYILLYKERAAATGGTQAYRY